MARRPGNYPPELRERAVRMVAEARADYPSEWAAMGAVAQKLGIGSTETLRHWVRRAELEAGARAGTSSEESAEIRRLRREVAELRRANDPQGGAGFLRGRARPATASLVRFIDEHKARRVGAAGLRWGAGPICAVLTGHGCPTPRPPTTTPRPGRRRPGRAG